MFKNFLLLESSYENILDFLQAIHNYQESIKMEKSVSVLKPGQSLGSFNVQMLI